ncbi:MAG: glycosyltransferase family 2 protein [Pseudomonadota bacterium]|nr:glycosyltransferase family 2 protein [Pseudomonadota bacterium]
MEVAVSKANIADAACFGRANRVESYIVTGWFVSPGGKAAEGQVAALIDGETCGRAAILTADDLPENAPKYAKAFSYPIPWIFHDGRSHALTLLLDNGTAVEFPTRSGVTRSNIRFRFAEPMAAGDAPREVDTAVQTLDQPRPGGSSGDFAGLVDALSGTTITGWSVCRRSPSDRVELRYYVDGHAAGRGICDQPHPDLKNLGLAGDLGGFRFELPERFLDGTTHSLTILFEDGTSLPFKNAGGGRQSALSFTAERTTSIEGIVDGLHGDNIRGWIVRKHHLTGVFESHVKVQVLCNGIVVGEVIADHPRMDVAREYHCDPCVGFEFKLPPHCRNGQEFEFVFRTFPEGEELAGCPLSVKHTAPEGNDLRALADTVGDLCAKAFKMQRQVLGLLPVADATVLNYHAWARRYQGRLRSRMALAGPLPEDAPLVSVVLPTYKTNLAHLHAAIESVRAQTYQNWELLIVDDGSRQRALNACLRTYAAEDPRIRCFFGTVNRGISGASNAAIRKAQGAFVMLFDHDDLLVEVALEALVREALRTNAKVVYADEDKVDSFGVFSEPNLKPDWNYRLVVGINYVCHPLMVDRQTLRRVGPMRSEFDGAQDHDLILRLSEKCKPEQIVHLPEILYHWRKSASSTADSGEAKPWAVEAGRRAVAGHLTRRGFADNQVVPVANSTTYSVSWGLSEQPTVTVIIPFKDQIATTRRCLESLLANTFWAVWKVVLVDNGSVTPEAGEFCREAVLNPNVAVMRVDEPFNYSRLNNIAARAYPADYYVFLNNDVFIDQMNWLRVMMDEALADPKVAIVGPKLIYPNKTIQHAGVILGVGGIADHVFRGIPENHPGYLNRARTAQRYSAVTAACMLCRADVFMDVGGFDEQELTVAFNDVDLCLKVGSRGWHIIWTPDFVAEHHESLSRGDDMAPNKAQRFFYENHVMLERWHDVLSADPFYSPHFSRDGGIFSDLR